jgi:hypothetical protein
VVLTVFDGDRTAARTTYQHTRQQQESQQAFHRLLLRQVFFSAMLRAGERDWVTAPAGRRPPDTGEIEFALV